MRLQEPPAFALLTDMGKARAHNEDACAADESAGLFVVCDGMGGAAGGEIASHTAARIFLSSARQLGLEGSPRRRLEAAVALANAGVFEEALRDPWLRGMGTTLNAIEVDTERGEVWTVNVGDSRCYRLRDDTLEGLTEDHSFVEEQVKLGKITEAEAAVSPMRNVITRAVGSHPDVEADVAVHVMEQGDLYLLCSDGLTRELSDDEIAEVLRTATDDLPLCARTLVDLANEAGGEDNISVVLVRV